MLRNSTAATVLVHKKFKYIFWIVLTVCFIGITGFLSIKGGLSSTKLGCTISIPKQTPARTDFLSSAEPRDCINLETVSNEESRRTGLSKYDSLPDNRGMLFIFDQPSQACMWMKDMKLNIDMIWVNEDKNVIKIEKNVSPETFPKTFCSQEPAKYVIELNSGVVDKAGVEVGAQLNL